MRLKIYFALIALFIASTGLVFSQANDGKITGKVLDEEGEPAGGAVVTISENGVVKGGAYTDEDGEFSIFPVSPGTYDVEVSYLEMVKKETGILVTAGKTVPIEFTFSGVTIGVIEIVEHEKDLFEKDQTVTSTTVTGAEFQKMTSRDINSAIATSAGVYQSDDGGGLAIKGGRGSGTVYFVDGVKVIGNTGLPQRAVSQMTVITGGTPPEYGDFAGGAVSITTSVPSYKLAGGLEIVSSQLTDNQGYNLIGVNLSGPIFTRLDTIFGGDTIRKTVLGFFIAMEGQYQKDNDPGASGVYKLKDGVLQDLQENPLRLSESGSFFVNNANYLTADDIEEAKFKDSNASTNFRGTLRLDFAPKDNMLVKFGMNFERNWFNSWNGWSSRGSLFALDGNRDGHNQTIRSYIRFQQTFPGDTGSTVKNFSYYLQADYTSTTSYSDYNGYGDDLFQYGYVGKSNLAVTPTYEYVIPDEKDPIYQAGITTGPYWQTSAFSFTNYTFDGSAGNHPILANYNNYIYNYVQQNGIQDPFSNSIINNVYAPAVLQQLGGILNGGTPSNIYSLYDAQGSYSGFYTKSSFEQYRVTGQASAEYKIHNFKIGFEFEQRVSRTYYITGPGLWGLARQLTNRHISNLDLNNPIPVYNNGVFQDTVNYNRLYVGSEQSTFDKNLRQSLGLPVNNTDYINIDGLDPSQLSVSMFSASELFQLDNGRQSVYSYNGYDYLGNKQKGKVSAEDFFSDTLNRPMDAFRPTYVAGFIQDKFSLQGNIFFNLGLRVSRFDNNQKVLKDPYVLYPTYTAQEAAGLLGTTLPSGVESDWVPYVDDGTNPTKIVGYRDGDKWYDATGAPVNPQLLTTASGEVQPYTKKQELTIDSFKDYDPKVNFLPRISFSFPISDKAIFYAHYDVLAQRPDGATQARLLQYLFLENNPTLEYSNPALQPQRTVDYEVGFRQQIGTNIALSISSFYREFRDQVQLQQLSFAYPIQYKSFTNLDFGTTKGFSFGFDLRRVKNIYFRGSYTLSFAEGTGSSFTSSRAAINAGNGFSVLRTNLPLSYDQRHVFSGNLDFRFVSANKHNGPKMFGKYPLKDFGINLVFQLRSGTPYSRNSIPNPSQVQFGINSQSVLAGAPLSNRLPWTYRFDLRFDKDFVLGGKEIGEGEEKITKKKYYLNVYVLLLNALNTKNIVNVYQTSGLPDDDGYLNTSVGQQTVSQQISPSSFSQLYSLKAQNPSNYTLPRRIRIGASINF